MLGWTVPESGLWNIDTFGSSYDTVLYVLQVADTDCRTELACDNRGGRECQSELSISLTAGQEVLIVVDGFGRSVSASGAYQLNITRGT